MGNERIISDHKNFWETLIGFDLLDACVEIESLLKKNKLRLSGKFNPNAQTVYITNKYAEIDLFTHRHLPLYQEIKTQLDDLGKVTTSLVLANAPMHVLIILEKEYQALNLFLERNIFLEIYQKGQEKYEACRLDMVKWYNKLAIDYSNDSVSFNGNVKKIVTLAKLSNAQRQSLITVLFQIKGEYEHHLFSNYTKQDIINEKWQAYFGQLIWKEDTRDIYDLDNNPLPIQKLWEKIETIFFLAKRPFYQKDSPVRDFLTKYLQRLPSDSGVVFNTQLNGFELIENYQQQLDL